MVAFLGMGLLGANFVRAMTNRGEKVQVWNRTPSKATALEQYGAIAKPSPAEAVKGTDRIHLTLKDDVSVDEVLAAAVPGLQPGAVIIDHTTTSVEGAIRRTDEWKSRGFIYLHAPVFMGPPNALEGTGNMLVSGDQQVVDRFTPILAKMTGKLLNFGPETGRAAAMKLLGNLFLVAFTTGYRRHPHPRKSDAGATQRSVGAFRQLEPRRYAAQPAETNDLRQLYQPLLGIEHGPERHRPHAP